MASAAAAAAVLLSSRLWQKQGQFQCADIPKAFSSTRLFPPNPNSCRRNHRFLTVASAYDGAEGQSTDDDEQWDPSLDIQVPEDQRPANELADLKKLRLYDWAELPAKDLNIRLGSVWLFLFLVPGAPIAAESYNPSLEPLLFLVSAGTGSLFFVALLIVHIYLGWSAVGDRLLSAVVDYEETGWYDGQRWVKPPEILARDRLLASYQVKPVVTRLKQYLLAAAALLTAFTGALVLLSSTSSIDDVVFVHSKRDPDRMIGYSVNDLLHPSDDLATNDDLAAAAAAAAKGKPAYCKDRYYRALAGGNLCK